VVVINLEPHIHNYTYTEPKSLFNVLQIILSTAVLNAQELCMVSYLILF